MREKNIQADSTLSKRIRANCNGMQHANMTKQEGER
jgi:hypothetical protein